MTRAALVESLAACSVDLKSGDLFRCEAMLLSQAHALQAIFVNLSRRATKQEYLKQWETYIRVALKAQNQCRVTLETLANLKNPPTVFARQANIAHGPQQVNNGVPSRAGEKEILQNGQSGGGHELPPNGRASQGASRVDTEVEAVGEIDGAKVSSG